MKAFFRKSAGYFLQGLLFITPLGVTIFVIVWFVNLLDELFEPLFSVVMPDHPPGVGLIFSFLVLSSIGYLIAHLVSRSAETWFDALMKRAPLAKVIYFSVKDLITVFFGKEEKMGKPVKVLMQRDPIQYRFGFLTRDDLSQFGFDENMISVYLPFSYGVMGTQITVDKKDVEFLNVSSSELMKFIVSGGVVQKMDGKSESETGQ